MSEEFKTPDRNNLDIANLRMKVQEIVDSREGAETYTERLQNAFENVLFSISRTIGKVEGGDVSSAAEISDNTLEELRAHLEDLRSLLP